jgi:hypothetical protein
MNVRGNTRWHGKSDLEMGLGLMGLISIKGCRSKAFPTFLPVSWSTGMLEDAGLGEPFGKASSAGCEEKKKLGEGNGNLIIC